MKKTLIMALLALATEASAQQNDTIVIQNPRKVTIISGDSLQKIIVRGKEGDEKFTYQNTLQLVDSNYVSTTNIGNDRWDLMPSVKVGKAKDGKAPNNRIALHLGVGFTNPTHVDSRLDFSTFKSWEIFATIIQWDHFLDRRERNFFSLGLGIDWKNYRMTDRNFFVKAPDGNVAVDRYPLEYEPDFSRIKVFSLTATFRFEHRFDDSFSIGFGPVVNFNTYASIKSEYELLGHEYEVVEKGIRQRPITIDWMLNAEFFNVPFYVKYSDDDVLKAGGLKFRSLSFGLYL